MKNIKKIIIGICAAFGVFVAITGFTHGENKQDVINDYGIPESHEWQIYINSGSNSDYLLNKKRYLRNIITLTFYNFRIL